MKKARGSEAAADIWSTALQLFSFRGLKPQSVNDSLLEIGSRAFSSVPFQYALFALIFFRKAQLRNDPAILGFFLLLNVSTVARFFLWKYGRKIMAHRHGRAVFRGILVFSALCIGTLWGGSCAHMFAAYGINNDSWFALCGILGAAATLIPMTSFDFGLTLIFQVLSLGLPLITLISRYHNTEADLMVGTIAVYFLVMCLLTKSMRGTQIALLQSYEKLEEQEKTLERTHADLVQTHGLVRTMLESIDQAFLLFNREGLCLSAPSEKSKALLASDPTNKHLGEIVPTAMDRANLSAWMEMLFLDRLEFEDLASHGPSRAEIAGHTLKLKFHPMRDEERKMSALVFTAVDITQEVKAEKAAAEERERTEMVLRILDAKSNFQPFLQDFQSLVKRLLTWNGQDVAGLRRDLHTMKGGAMIFGAGVLAEAVYAIELAILNHGGKSRLTEMVRSRGARLEEFFTSWQQQNLELFTQLGVFAGQDEEISIRRIEELEAARFADPTTQARVREILDRLLNSPRRLAS